MKPRCLVSGASAANSVTGSKPATLALPPSMPPPKPTDEAVGEEIGVEQAALGGLGELSVELEAGRAVGRGVRVAPCGDVLAAAGKEGAELDLLGLDLFRLAMAGHGNLLGIRARAVSPASGTAQVSGLRRLGAAGCVVISSAYFVSRLSGSESTLGGRLAFTSADGTTRLGDGLLRRGRRSPRRRARHRKSRGRRRRSRSAWSAPRRSRTAAGAGARR